MRFTPFIGTKSTRIEVRSNAPRKHPCPNCGKTGRRIRLLRRAITHIAYQNRCVIDARYGEYKAKCDCCTTFRSEIPGVPKGGKYSYEVRNVIANTLIRDRLPYRKVQKRMKEEFDLEISVGFIHDCFHWAHGEIDLEARREWATRNFSGVLCIDEMHDGPYVLLYATDPISDITVDFAVHTKNDQEGMDQFLNQLHEGGIHPEVVITDGSPLYKTALMEVFGEIAHQLCIFHVINEVNTLVLKALRKEKNRIKRQGNKGRKRKQGRPSKAAKFARKYRKRPTRKQQARFLWENQHLIVKKEENLSDEEKDRIKEMKEISPEIEVLREFSQQFYRLFERGITMQQARYRRTRMANNKDYRNTPLLKKALKKLRRNRFEKMIVYLDHGEDAERTNNHVERNNRCFRMLQKTRYRRRKKHTITMAIELDLYERMLHHPKWEEDSDLPDLELKLPPPHAA